MARNKYESNVKPMLAAVEGWARDGLTLEQIAKNLGISKQSLYKYRDQHVDFFDALKRGKEVADYEVENALFREATGYEYIEENLLPSGKVVRVRKFARPSTTAQIFWLKNRKTDQWRDKQEHKHEVTTSLADILAAAAQLEADTDDDDSDD